MSNETNINILLSRAKADLDKIRDEYQQSLEVKTISADLKIDIKNLCGNLRSCLDYLAHDIREHFCTPGSGASIFYFPIQSNASAFTQKMSTWFPGLATSAPQLYSYLESIQPYKGVAESWLMEFNTVNNDNKHQKLLEQVRVETEWIEAKSEGGGVVAWNPAGVTFGSGVFINGVPVNPQTQMPVPSPRQEIKRTIWVDFKFEDPHISVLPLLEKSMAGIEHICITVRSYL